MAHRCGFDEPTIKATLEEVGFAHVATLSRPEAFDLWALATLEEWPEENLCDAALTLLPILPGAFTPTESGGPAARPRSVQPRLHEPTGQAGGLRQQIGLIQQSPTTLLGLKQ